MAIRSIRELGDPVLNKKSKVVKEITPRIAALIEDMKETMYESGGVGLAAPQVGILKRIAVIDVSEEQNDLHVFINPEIILAEGEQEGLEGCLSVPGKMGNVTRPNHVITRAYDENMQLFEIEGEGLFARAMCHEFDHLDGKVYVDLVDGPLLDTEADFEEYDEEATFAEAEEEFKNK